MDALRELMTLSEDTANRCGGKLTPIMSIEPTATGENIKVAQHQEMPPLFSEIKEDIMFIRKKLHQINEYLDRVEL